MQEKPVISIKDLVVGFGDQIVLDHLSLDVRKGEILGVVGKSGGGKSVLLRTIIGLLPKRHGKIEVLGVDLDTATEQQRRALERRWGVLFQQGALFSSLTVRQNVQFPMRENLEDLAAPDGRDGACQARHGGAHGRRCRQVSGGVVGRHDQARGACPRARA